MSALLRFINMWTTDYVIIVGTDVRNFDDITWRDLEMAGFVPKEVGGEKYWVKGPKVQEKNDE